MIPFTDFFSVSWKENTWNREFFEMFWSWILGVFFFSTEFFWKWLFFKRLRTEYSRYEPHNTINPYKRTELSAWENIWSDGYFFDLKERKYSLIDSLIVATNQTIMNRRLCIWGTFFLCESLSTWWGVYDFHFSELFLKIDQGIIKRLYGNNCSSSSAIWMVINTTSIFYCPVCEIVKCITKEPLFLGSFHYTAFEIYSHTFWKKWENMNMDHNIIWYR